LPDRLRCGADGRENPVAVGPALICLDDAMRRFPFPARRMPQRAQRRAPSGGAGPSRKAASVIWRSPGSAQAAVGDADDRRRTFAAPRGCARRVGRWNATNAAGRPSHPAEDARKPGMGRHRRIRCSWGPKKSLVRLAVLQLVDQELHRSCVPIGFRNAAQHPHLRQGGAVDHSSSLRVPGLGDVDWPGRRACRTACGSSTISLLPCP